MKHASIILCILLALVACKPTGGEQDGGTRHYDVDYNFLVTTDSLVLQEERPMHMLIVPETADTMTVYRGDPLVVAQIEVIPEDSIDSVWVKVARDQMTQGWIHESTLLQSVVPDDPISQGIHLFSDAHIVAVLGLCLVALVAVMIRGRRYEVGGKRYEVGGKRYDIPSPYPMLLRVAFATATVLYTSIQIFVPDLWAHFYYNPTLNPFGLPTMLALFLGLAWLIVILFLAALDDIRRCLSAVDAIRYTLALLAFLGILYLVFALATQHFLGYPLLLAYGVFAVVRYWRHHRAHFRCGQCGAPLHEQGQCPKCGTWNEA